MIRLAILLALATQLPAQAAGFRQWTFGMSKNEVRSIGEAARYYAFKNGDLGAGKEAFEDGEALISFYFNDEKLARVMLIPHMGADHEKARLAWIRVYQHLRKQCAAVEIQMSGQSATLEDVLAAYDTLVPKLGFGQRHQIGCLPMPADQLIWASATGSNQGELMIAVNYAKR